MLRILLPPNLAAAASRNAIAVKIEIVPDRSRPRSCPRSPGSNARRLNGQSRRFFCNCRAPNCAKSSDSRDQPVFFWVNRPVQLLAWNDGLLPE